MERRHIMTYRSSKLVYHCEPCTLVNQKKTKATSQWETGYSPRPATLLDQNTVWHCGWPSCSSQS